MIRTSQRLLILCCSVGLMPTVALAQPTGETPERRPAPEDPAPPEAPRPFATPARPVDPRVKPRAAAPATRPVTVPQRAAKPPPQTPLPRKPAPKPAPQPAPPEDTFRTGFGFGSYGRIGVATDAEGGPGRQMNLVTHGPRLGEGPYLEIDLYYKMRPFGDVKLQTVITLAFTEELFHFSGDWDSAIALRNFYLEGQDLFVKGLSVWMGSRMYRGDDIYLLDWWPLDNLNTIGAGVHYRYRQTQVGWQLGVNRLKDQYQYQEVQVPGLNNTSETIVLLNRQRLITSLKAEQHFGGANGKLGAKVKLYGEYHHLGSGTLNAHLPIVDQEELQSDYGWLIGLQAGVWNFGPRSHANLFVRYAQGLAAYGEFAIPFGLDTAKRARDAREFLIALSANWELRRWFGVQAGGFVRYFRDADPNQYDWDDGWEYVAVMRPHVFLHRLFALAFELSYQARQPAGLNPWTHEKVTPGILKFSVLPLLTFGKGTYGRPQFRLIYTVFRQNEGARLSWNPLDPRAGLKIGHYLGLQAEWWFNSTYR